MTTYTPEQLARAHKAGDVTVTKPPVAFTYWLEGPDGAAFALFREPHHLDADIMRAKYWLVDNRDVTRFQTYYPEKGT